MAPQTPPPVFGPDEVDIWDAATIESYQGDYGNVLSDAAAFRLQERFANDQALRRDVDPNALFEIMDLVRAIQATTNATHAATQAAALAEAQASAAAAQAAAAQANALAAAARVSALDTLEDPIVSVLSPLTRDHGTNSSVWAIAPPVLAEWDDFSTDEAVRYLSDKEVGAEAFDPPKPFDANCSETDALHFLLFGCIHPLDEHILSKPPLSSSSTVTSRSESETPVNSRPDSVWFRNGRPLVVHEHKAPNCLPALAASTRARLNIPRLVEYAARYSATMAPISQLYSYMVVLGLRYGVLSTTQYTWFFRREDTADESKLLVTEGFDCQATGNGAVRLAYFQMILYALGDDDATEQFPAPTDALYTRVLEAWRSRLASNRVNVRSEPWIATRQAVAFVNGVVTAYQGGRRQGLLDLNLGLGLGLDRNTGTSTRLAGSTGGVRGGGGGGGGGRSSPRGGAAGAAAAANDAAHAAAGAALGNHFPLTRDEFESILPVPWDPAFENVSDSNFTNVKRLTLRNGVRIFIKFYVVRSSDEAEVEEHRRLSMNEVRVYNALRDVQGGYVPILIYGGPVGQPEHNINVVATLDMGLESSSGDEAFGKVRAPLEALHKAGFSHESIISTHFLRDAVSGDFHILSFSHAQPLPVDDKRRARVIADELRELRENLC